MADLDEELEKWFEKFGQIPKGAHLLCPRVNEYDEEDYSDPDCTLTISLDEKKRRIEAANERIEITYFNSLVFGYPAEVAGNWLAEFTSPLNHCLGTCSDCVLNWHMKRKLYLQKFTERWDEEAASHIKELFSRLDVTRIGESLQWAKNCIESIEATGKKFKKSMLGADQPKVHIAIFEALCCVDFLSKPDQRELFQFVFRQLQGTKGLKLGRREPLPAMTWFLFDYYHEERRNWAIENWKHLDNLSINEEQFDWAISQGLIKALEVSNYIDLKQASAETYIEMEKFWEGFELILGKLKDDLLSDRLRHLEYQGSNRGGPYELVFAHAGQSRTEGLLRASIRVLTQFLLRSGKTLWDVVGDAKPNVVADILLLNNVYQKLLQQSLQDFYAASGAASDIAPEPFATSWIAPWLQSVGRDRMFDACDYLLHTLFGTLANHEAIGGAGQVACIRAGFDALRQTILTFVHIQGSIGIGTTRLYANMTLSLILKHKDILIAYLQAPENGLAAEAWTVFKVAESGQKLIEAAMMLDIKLFFDENEALRKESNKSNANLNPTPRSSQSLWTFVDRLYDASQDPVTMAKSIFMALAGLVSVECIMPRKNGGVLDEATLKHNSALKDTTIAISKIIGRMTDLDPSDLGTIFADRLSFQVVLGLSTYDESSDLATYAMALLKAWTGEDSRQATFEHMTRLHTEQTLSSLVWTMGRVLDNDAPWGPIEPLVKATRSVLRGLGDHASGVLRGEALSPKVVAITLRWWNVQWRFVSRSCTRIEHWSHYLPNKVMTEFCREIMELAEALIAEDGLITSATAQGKSETAMMTRVLQPAKENFQGMENMIRLKDTYLVEVTVKVLCKILTRLRETGLEIAASSRNLITDACIASPSGKYHRSTNLEDQQRAQLLEALGHVEPEVEFVKERVIGTQPTGTLKPGTKKQSRLDEWSKSGRVSSPASSSSSSAIAATSRTNRDDVLELSKSADNPLLRMLSAQQAKPKTNLPDLKKISALKASRDREKEAKKKRDAEAIAKAKKLRGETVSGEGSGLLSLGITGKDHSRSEIMVNSSDEDTTDESEDDEDDNQLFAISKGVQNTLDEEERRRRQTLREMTRRPVKKVRQQRSVKDMKARLVPPMERLHNTILAWDLFHRGNDPPSGPKSHAVAPKYENSQVYRETFFPLLASEAWRAFVTAKDEETAQPFGMKILTRATVDSFMEVTYTMPVTQNRERGVSEGDILLVSEAEQPLANEGDRHCLARVHKLKNKKEHFEVTFRVASRNNPLSPCLNPNLTVFGIKITNMTTIEREFAALESLQYYDLMDEILKAEPSPILRYGDERISQYVSNWTLNRAQALAVLGAQENDGFTLIQGPPGTGKTKTIVAMVGCLLSEHFAQAPNNIAGITSIRPGGITSSGASGARSKKLLVCAPSNAAVDELVLRLKNGVKTLNRKERKINVLRLGRSDAINTSVKDVTLDEMVRIRLEGDSTRDNAIADRDKLHTEAGRIKEELAQLRPMMEAAKQQNSDQYSSLQRKHDELKTKQVDIGREIDRNKDSGNTVAREVELRRRQIQQEILNGAHVICATLSGSGHDMFRSLDVEFETVIIDEAAQCVELSALIPLKYGCCKCILVGDPKQLPPTVLSQSAAKFGYDQSLFVRMQQNHPNSVHLLNMQYRMHPDISRFPSKEFYEGQLQDGQDMLQLRQKPWHKHSVFSPYRFFDVQGSGVQERGRKGQSYLNTKELDVAVQLYDRFRREFGVDEVNGKIGIITPYKAQLMGLRDRFRSRFGESITETIDFNTTDAFQGRECEIIIFSCVRASSTEGIGFMKDIRRMNVGLTRAKSSLWILGDSRALRQGEFWNKLIEDAQARHLYTDGDISSQLRKPLLPQQNFPTINAPRITPSPAAGINGDVEMTEAPSLRMPAPQDSLNTTQKRPSEQNNQDHRAVSDTQYKPETVVPRSAGLPVIHTELSVPENSQGKKRSLPSPDSPRPMMKRMTSERPRGGLMGKFGQKPNRSVMLPTDPAALSTLGLVPPERPPAPPSLASIDQVKPTSSVSAMPSLQKAQKPSIRPQEKNEPPAPPLQRKKNKPSLFLPKKR